ncbi:hypothetical protein [Flavobacterium columnare]|uniref:hypothetical protein n=1 Tax=Flavobacterium columnare TaxID=996 RepID=UPI002989F5EB|nr:hypothetical protein [Flavobacterium columnare]MCH4828197.1 hypothetical protein [Flavobacterium columnare]
MSKQKHHKPKNIISMGAPSKHKIYTEYYQTEAINYKKHLDILGLNPETTQARYLYLKEFLVG